MTHFAQWPAVLTLLRSSAGRGESQGVGTHADEEPEENSCTFTAYTPLILILLATGCDTSTKSMGMRNIFPPAGAGTAEPGSSGPNGNGPNKTLCAHILQCFKGCNDHDDPCFQACHDSATPAARSAFDALEACGEGAGCKDAACVEATCPAEVAVCFGRRPG